MKKIILDQLRKYRKSIISSEELSSKIVLAIQEEKIKKVSRQSRVDSELRAQKKNTPSSYNPDQHIL